jgi:hypothetical protein
MSIGIWNVTERSDEKEVEEGVTQGSGNKRRRRSKTHILRHAHTFGNMPLSIIEELQRSYRT